MEINVNPLSCIILRNHHDNEQVRIRKVHDLCWKFSFSLVSALEIFMIVQQRKDEILSWNFFSSPCNEQMDMVIGRVGVYKGGHENVILIFDDIVIIISYYYPGNHDNTHYFSTRINVSMYNNNNQLSHSVNQYWS